MAHTLKIVVKNAHNPAASPVGGQYPVAFIRKNLRADEVFPADERFNAATGKVQWTPDGSTWIDAPELDPRYQTNVPARTGVTDNCPAAQSVAEYFRRYINLVTSVLSAGATLVQGASALLGFLDLLGGYGILWDIIQGLFGTLAGYGAGAIAAAFTSDQYDKLACILLCNMQSSQLNQASLDAVKQQVSAQLNATAAPIVNLMLDVMGFAGVNRAALFYTTGRSCSACPSCNWSYAIDLTYLDSISQPFASPEYSGTFTPTAPAAYGGLTTVAGHVAMQGIKLAGFNQAAFSRVFPIDIPAGSTLTKVSMWYQSANTNMDNFVRFLVNLTTGEKLAWTGPFHTMPMELSGSWAGLNQFYLGARVNTTTSTGVQLLQVVLTGTGPRPALPSVTKYY